MLFVIAYHSSNPDQWPFIKGKLIVTLGDLLFHFLKTDVSDILALDEVDDILTDITGVISNTLQRTRGPDRIQGTGDIAGIFHHIGD